MNAPRVSQYLPLALHLAAHGIAVFPVNIETKQPAPGLRWREESTHDANQVMRLWAAHPDAGVAIDCGKSGLIVIDCDRHGGPDGVTAFWDLAKTRGGISRDAPLVHTAGSGVHCYFRNVEISPLGISRGKLPAGIDVRGNGGYVIAPGNTRPGGTGWQRVEGAPDVAEAFAAGAIPRIYDWIVDQLPSRDLPPPAPAPSRAPTAPTPREIDYALKKQSNECQAVARAVPGSRNDTLNKAAFAVGTCVGAGWIERADCEAKLIDAAAQCGLDSQEARKTIRSGLNGGMKNPRPPLGHRSAEEIFPDGLSQMVTTSAIGPVNDGSFPPPGSAPAVRLINAASITPDLISWLWQGYLARGKIHLLAGAPGTGKTTLAIRLAAIVSSGGLLPDGSRCPIGNVVIWSGEDDPTDTLVPRLAAAGANMSNCYFVGDVIEDGRKRAFDPARDMVRVGDAVKMAGGAALIILDPIVSAISGDSHKNADVRRGFQPLVDLALENRCAILGITHFTKGSGGRDPVERVTGSIGFGAVARIVMVAAKKEGDEEGQEARRIFMRAKSNLGPDDGGFTYTLRQVELKTHPGIFASVAEFGESIEGNAREALATAEADSSADGDALADAKEFLCDALHAGPLGANKIRAAATVAGHSWATIRRAKDSLGIKAIKISLEGGWVWSLPEGAHARLKIPNQNSVSTFASDAHLRAQSGPLPPPAYPTREKS